MKFRTFTGLVVSSTLFSAAVDAQPSTEVFPQLELVWNDHYRLLPQGFDGVARNIETCFAEMGIEARWDTENPPTSAGIRVQIVLASTDPSRRGLPEKTMGVVIGNEVPRSSVFVFLTKSRCFHD